MAHLSPHPHITHGQAPSSPGTGETRKEVDAEAYEGLATFPRTWLPLLWVVALPMQPGTVPGLLEMREHMAQE